MEPKLVHADQLHIIGLQIDQKMFLMNFLEKFPTGIVHIIVCVCFCWGPQTIL